MTRRALRAVLSSALLLTACTSSDAPPPESEQTPPTPEPTPTPVPIDGGPVVPVDAPQGSSLEWVRANACEDAAPMSLTASDGTGLRLASLTARSVVEGPLAFTELRLSFDNPEDRQLEGRFSITLPPGAAISRFAMQIDGRWQEGEVVERQAARVAYEDFLHRRQDPALLENDAGNVFRARVFPIPPRARKELVLSYSQELAHSAEPYRLPLCGLPELDLLDVDVAIVQGAVAVPSSLPGQGTSVYHLTLRREKLAPTKDLEARVGSSPAQGLRHGDLAVVRVVPVLASPADPVDALTILVDTSASRALDFRGQIDRLGTLMAALPGAARIKLLAYDQGTELLYDGRADGLGTAPLDRLRERGALGASDLGQALDALTAMGGAGPRLLLVGDGVVTAGRAEPSELQELLRSLGGRGLRRVDAIVDGGIQDEETLTALTRAGLGSDGVVLDARLEARVLAERLGQATRSGIAVEVPGAEWVWPRTLDGVQPGDERLVYAQLPPETPLQVKLGGVGVREPQPTLAMVPEPLLARAHAQARIAALQTERAELPADDAQGRKRLADEIVSLSTRHRVLSDLTALLVLETEADYARFGIDRRALADILTVGPAGVELMRRVEPVAPVPEVVEMPVATPEFKAEKTVMAEDDAKDKGSAAEEVDGFLARGDGEGGEADPDVAAPSDAPGGLAFSGTGRGGGGVADELGAVEQEEEPSLEAPPPPRPEPAPERTASATGRRDSRPARRRERVDLGSSDDALEGLGGSGGRGETPPAVDPYQGRFATVMEALGRGDVAGAEREATAWRGESPGDVLALVAIGEASEARGDLAAAARAYGSLIDLFPSRADIRRMAGERLERLGDEALTLAIDTYAHAVEQRPDHPSSHRLYAYALLKAGHHAEAFAALEASLERSYPGGRFAGVEQVLREDLGLVGAAWIAVDPTVRKKVEDSLSRHLASLPTSTSTRFVLNWETDANDVDLHVYDARGGHAYYSSRSLASGGQLYADVTTGYGPECFAIDGKRGAGPYRVMAHYYRRGPMGYGMGKLQVIEHDGHGGLSFGEHPFVIMKDDGYVDLATVGASIGTTPVPRIKPRPSAPGMTRLE
ncbi:MAG: hypothetical protein H6712_25635 [Myxococcales bacterium]|nr:hypothetical protein [Myxococcales bacterium]